MNHFTYMNKRAQSLVLAMLLVFSCFSQFNQHLGKNPAQEHSFFCVLASLFGLEWTADHQGHDHHADHAGEGQLAAVGEASYRELQFGHAMDGWALTGLYFLMSWTILIGLAAYRQAQNPVTLFRRSQQLQQISLPMLLRAMQPRAPPVLS